MEKTPKTIVGSLENLRIKMGGDPDVAYDTAVESITGLTSAISGSPASPSNDILTALNKLGKVVTPGSGGGGELPAVTPTDEGKILKVINGKWGVGSESSGGMSDESYTLLAGKKAVFLGDSQTAANWCKTKIWWEWVKEELNLGTCVNYGVGGSTIVNMASRYNSMPNDADIVFVMGGINDLNQDIPLGDITSTSTSTFCGAVKKLCTGLREKYPAKPVIFINCTNHNNTGVVHNEGYTATDFANAMIEVCKDQGMLCLDAHGSLGINPKYDETFTVSDKLHLNDLGSELLGKWVAQQVKNNIRYIYGEATVIPVTGISLTESTLTILEGNKHTLFATITPSNATNRSITWTTSDNTVATVDSAGEISAVGVGNATITATTVDGGFTATCSVTVERNTIEVTGVSLNKNSTTIQAGNTETLTATLSPSGAIGTISWSSSDTSKATVNNGTITAVATGTSIITATCKGYSATCEVTVIDVTGISLNESAISMEAGDTTTLVATLSPEGITGTIEWVSSDTSLATVNNGLVTAIAAGTATITATCRGYSATCEITITASTKNYLSQYNPSKGYWAQNGTVNTAQSDARHTEKIPIAGNTPITIAADCPIAVVYFSGDDRVIKSENNPNFTAKGTLALFNTTTPSNTATMGLNFYKQVETIAYWTISE